ncbi:ABC transporter permease [Pectinatus cerevisiiphilus]|uniref:NitT/TauT family transport system permease protein n=1 Tax=Pectinatus cerevisiiphilus TaxID=86956 RepID=A0A4R3K441_9FIRM|nr:ABC transporter permease [Pectinatus cerevisiiphilus]TCS77476.1 NitT/TauT family transport system permease protein [Pectinatus cerevisiiphilus]
MEGFIRKINERFIDASGVILFLLLWEFLPRAGIVDGQFIPPLSKVIEAIVRLFFVEHLLLHIAASLQRVFIGVALAIILAVPIGFALSTFKKVAVFLRPLLRIGSQINAFALFPIFILIFGIGETAKISIIFCAAFWPILFTTVAGVSQIDPLYIKSAKSMGAGHFTIFKEILLPGTAPLIFTGIHHGTTQAFLMLIAAEMIGAKAGLGWIILNSTANSLMPRLFAAGIIIALLGMLLSYLIHWWEKIILFWQEDANVN